ncbi:MAG: hypothetical protein ACLQO6_08185 [Desulfomonilaceae bacterium]
MGVFCHWSSIVNAENEPTGACSFLGVKKTDRVGKTKPEPDGIPDAVFSLTFSTPLADKRIEEIEIMASNPSKSWTSHLEGHNSDISELPWQRIHQTF